MTENEFDKLLSDFVHDSGNFWPAMLCWLDNIEHRGIKEGEIEEISCYIKKWAVDKNLGRKPNELWLAYKELKVDDND